MRTLTFIAASLFVAGAAAAEPAKAPVEKPVQIEQSKPIVVAAADQATQRPTVETAQQQQATDAKPVRRARVTTCRCGDQTPNNQ